MIEEYHKQGLKELGFNFLEEHSGFSSSTLFEHTRHLLDSHLIFQDKKSKKYSIDPTPQVLTTLPQLITLTTTVSLTISETTIKYETTSKLYNQSKETKHLIPMFIENNETATWESLEPIIKFGKITLYDKHNPPQFETQNDNTLKFFLTLNLEPQSIDLLAYQYTYQMLPYFFTTVSLLKKELIFKIHYTADIEYPPTILKQIDNKFQEISPKSIKVINPKSYQLKETQIPANTTYYIFWNQQELQKFKEKLRL
ncbi:MAG: hypothetical protein ABI342_00430 [Nitrososphaera sp.]|jgi:hypothetical protein